MIEDVGQTKVLTKVVGMCQEAADMALGRGLAMLTRTVEPEYLNDDDVMMAGLEAVDEGFLQVGD